MFTKLSSLTFFLFFFNPLIAVSKKMNLMHFFLQVSEVYKLNRGV